MAPGNGKVSRDRFNYIKLGAILLVVFGLTFIFFGGETVLGLKPASIHMIVYAYSSLEEVLNEGILPAFERSWESETGSDLEIDAVFGPSGTLARQMHLVGTADVAILSNSRHVAWLKMEGVVYFDTPIINIGFSPIVIITRRGNPLKITNFQDLAQPRIEVLHADPRNSGAGEWSLLAEYYSTLKETNDRSFTEERFVTIWHNVSQLGSSARTSLTAFETGAGDVLVTYEQDALFARERGVPLEIVMPRQTIAAENAAVIVDKNVNQKERPAAEAFMEYLLSDEALGIFNRYYLRPVTQLQHRSAVPPQFFTVEELGGWSIAYTESLESLWQAKIAPGLEPDQ